MNRRLCSSQEWAQGVRNHVIPWALDGVELGEDLLEIGPGYGSTTRVLLDLVTNLTAVEIDPALTPGLTAEFGDRATIVVGDGTAMPFPPDSFTGVACFTVLHHIPGAHLQDRLFTEACRVLRPGGVFAGSDSGMSFRFIARKPA